jgi:hypothetical protein
MSDVPNSLSGPEAAINLFLTMVSNSITCPTLLLNDLIGESFEWVSLLKHVSWQHNPTWMDVIMTTETAKGSQLPGSWRLLELDAREWFPRGALRRPLANCINTCPYSSLWPDNTKPTWMNVIITTVTAKGGQRSGSLKLLELGAPEWFPHSAMWQSSAPHFNKDPYSSMLVDIAKPTWMALVWLFKYVKVGQQSVLLSVLKKRSPEWLPHFAGGHRRLALMKISPRACN